MAGPHGAHQAGDQAHSQGERPTTWGRAGATDREDEATEDSHEQHGDPGQSHGQQAPVPSRQGQRWPHQHPAPEPSAVGQPRRQQEARTDQGHHGAYHDTDHQIRHDCSLALLRSPLNGGPFQPLGLQPDQEVTVHVTGGGGLQDDALPGRDHAVLAVDPRSQVGDRRAVIGRLHGPDQPGLIPDPDEFRTGGLRRRCPRVDTGQHGAPVQRRGPDVQVPGRGQTQPGRHIMGRLGLVQ
ncbi:hypothetical protein ACFFX0_22280 [Citricoccus parietis]|uniref:Uncharacterized protein n=1 Tax=Citricoccus parietis TaxID=592307 RepID=A0ABV5G4B3_9MICC